MRKLWTVIISGFLLLPLAEVLARAGGGGSSSGGSSSSGSGGGSLVVNLIYLSIGMIGIIYYAYKRRQKIKKAKAEIALAAAKDKAWDPDGLKKRVKEVFLQFQKDWSALQAEPMQQYLTQEYYKRMVLEMSVLQSMGRKNQMDNVIVYDVTIMEASDSADDSQDRFVAEVRANANDRLIDTKENKILFEDDSTFTEYWHFVRIESQWKLDVIKQETEAASLKEVAVQEFARRNNFYYDPDFGWLMMPSKGALFRETNFGKSDINNHVIGYYKDKVVEFYTYIPRPNENNGGTNYLVAQIVLPISYKDILVRRKRWLLNWGPRGLRRIHTESNDFERKFCLWADPEDQVSSFELLTPNFMEKVYELPFELNIEVVGHYLYFYAKSRKSINYEKMLEILSWAFEEMKR